MKILDMSAGERPRERMFAFGPEALANGELLAVILRSGTKGESALEMAQRLLNMAEGSLVALFSMTPAQLRAVPGMGMSRAAALLAAFELGRRFLLDDSGVRGRPLLTSRMIYDCMIPRLKGLLHEENWVLYLNSGSYLLGMHKVSSGNLNTTVVDSRQILKTALDRGASGLVMVHNHPSGNPTPSIADINETDRLRKACNSMGLSLSDHVVVCDGGFFSFAEDRRYSR